MKREHLRRETKWLRKNLLSVDFGDSAFEGFDSASRLTLGRRLSSAFTGLTSHMATVVVAITCTLIIAVQVNRANLAELNAQHSDERASLLAEQEEKMRDYASSRFYAYREALQAAIVTRKYDEAIRLLPVVQLDGTPEQVNELRQDLTLGFLMDVYGVGQREAASLTDAILDNLQGSDR